MRQVHTLTAGYADKPKCHQARVLQNCLASAMAYGHTETPNTSTAERLVLWGIGNPEMEQCADAALKFGAHVVCWDLGYFQRKGTDDERGWRFSIDALHPDKFIMAREWPSDRWDALGIKLRNDWNPDGPILLVGMGYKSAIMYKERVGQWEGKAASDIRKLWPNRKLIFRPKPGNPRHCQSVSGAEIDNSRPIEEALKGASLVVCRHSNVSIDAVIAGVPFHTQGGAAKAIILNQNSELHRLKLLRNLAYFEWRIEEIRTRKMWEVIETMITDIETLRITV